MSAGHTGYGGRRFELRAGTIYVLPLEVEKAPGVTSITVGFPLAEMSEYVDADTAAGLVDYLNQPADLLGRCLEAARKAKRELENGNGEVMSIIAAMSHLDAILSQAREVK